jgi:hypothetical protein
MWLKRHHTPVFYAASLAKTEGDSERTLLRDAVKHGIEVRPPSIVSGATWDVGMEDEIYAGWKQIPGIADRMAERIEDHGPYKELADLERVPGIGPKKLETITAFAEASDPFGIYRLEENIESVRADVAKGIDSAQGKLPEPSHTANEIFDERGGARITMLGQPVHLNLRDIFEANRAKTGEALDPATVKNPELSQWVVMTVRDADDLASFVISRKRYPKFKEMIWKVQLESDQLVLITGKKGKMKGTLGDRSGIVFVDRMWVLQP